MASKKPPVPTQRKRTEKKPVHEEEYWGVGGHVPEDPSHPDLQESTRRNEERTASRKALEAENVKKELAGREAAQKAEEERVRRDHDEAVAKYEAMAGNKGQRTRGSNKTTPANARFETMRACLGRM